MQYSNQRVCPIKITHKPIEINHNASFSFSQNAIFQLKGGSNVILHEADRSNAKQQFVYWTTPLPHDIREFKKKDSNVFKS